MSLYDADFAAANDSLLEGFGDTIVYKRGSQAITLQAIRGGSQTEATVQYREHVVDELHCETWDLRIADLDGLTGDGADTIECHGVTFNVINVDGDQSWDYITPDRTWVRVRTEPA